MIENLLSAATTASSMTLSEAITYAACAGILGLVISLTYIKTGNFSKNFARTLIVLPILVCVVMMAVNGNFGTSLAVVGAFSLVRFRSLQGSSRDIGFIFFTMTVGIVCAIGQLPLAAIITALVCMVHFALSLFKYADKTNEEKNLRVTIPENLDYTGVFDDLFEKYTVSHKQLSIKTTNMGSMYEITYRIKMIEDELEKELIDAIRMRNGNLTVICGRCDVNEQEEL